MYIPDLKVSMIDPEINAGFICNYLSREKSENKTRPFYEKTILLYPELKDAQEILDIREKEEFIREAVIKRLAENQSKIQERIEHFRDVFDTFIPGFIEAECRLFDYEWKPGDKEINCYVGNLPFYPRSTMDKAFYVSYHDEERVFSGAVHEINHMIFFEKWKEMHGECKERQWPDPLWYLEEIIVDPTLNDERVKHHTLYENRAYPVFYEEDESGQSLMDKVKKCYEKADSIEAFLDETYKIIKTNL